MPNQATSVNGFSYWTQLGKIFHPCPPELFPEENEERLARILREQVSQLKGAPPDTVIANVPGARVAAREFQISFKTDDRWRLVVPAAVATTFKDFMAARRERVTCFGDVTLRQAKRKRKLFVEEQQLDTLLFTRVDQVTRFSQAGRNLERIKQMGGGDFKNQTKEQLLHFAEYYGVKVSCHWRKFSIRRALLLNQIGPRTEEYFQGPILADLLLGKCHTSHQQLCICDQTRSKLLDVLLGVTVSTLSDEMFLPFLERRDRVERARDERYQRLAAEITRCDLLPMNDIYSTILDEESPICIPDFLHRTSLAISSSLALDPSHVMQCGLFKTANEETNFYARLCATPLFDNIPQSSIPRRVPP